MRLVLSCLLLSSALAGADLRLSCEAADGRPAQAVLGALLTLDPDLGDLHTDLLVAGRGDLPVTMVLVDRAPAGARQALAHALGAWWMDDRNGRIRFLADQRLPTGAVSTRTHVSVLANAPGREALVERLMAPWLTGDAGVSYEVSDATWTATLDQEGHAILDQVLHALEGRDAPIPPLVPDAEVPDPDRPLAAWQARSWHEAVRALAALGVSSSVSPGLIQDGLPGRRLDIPAGRSGDLPRRLALAGIQGDFIQGVLCLAGVTEIVEDRQHPAQRRRLAALPLRHLVRDGVEGLALTATLRDRVMPWWWSRPGAGLWFLENHGVLLVAADATAIHAVMAALVQVDRLGLEQGLLRLHGGRTP